MGSTNTLLKHGCTRKGRVAIAKASGLSVKRVLKFVNHADLMRIEGIGGEYSELLEASGVDSVKELARRDPTSLFEKIRATNGRRSLVRQIPTQRMVHRWVTTAKRLKPMVSH